jgi:hypothetical protein
MIASINPSKSKTASPAWHAPFLKMLPAVRRQASLAFRAAPPELREELIAAVVANCLVDFVRLVEQGKQSVAFPSALARYGIAQVRAGRRVGNRLCVHDAMSSYCQFRKGVRVERLDQFDDEENCWKQIVVEDGRATPADVAACRVDFSAWLQFLPARRRKVALALAAGETTKAAAEKFSVSPARIAQLRGWLKKSWELFQGGPEMGGRPQPVAA